MLLVCGLFMTALGGTASAASPSGSCGKNVFWSLDRGTGILTISGQGEMYDYSVEIDEVYFSFTGDAPWWEYRHVIKEVCVEDGVTYIGKNVFCGDPYISSDSRYAVTILRIADSVTEIGDYAFQYCSLESVELGTGLKRIGKQAFSENEALVSVTLPDGLTEVGASAFSATAMKEIVIPRSVTFIGEGAFGCNTHVYGGGDAVSVGFTVIGYEGSAAEAYYEALLARYIEEKNLEYMKTYYPGNYPADGTVYFKAIKSAAINVTVNGTAVSWTDATPFIDDNSRTMVPLRAVAESLGLTVSWDSAKREAVFTDGTKTICFPIGSSIARTDDGGKVQMDTAAVIVSDRTFAPVRYLAEFFDYQVDWDGKTRTVLIWPTPAAADADPLDLYGPLLKEYKAVISGEMERDYAESLMGDPSFFELNRYYPEAGYAFLDLNQDGVLELLVGPCSESESYIGIVYDLFTSIDGSIIKLAESVERGCYYLLEDGMLRLDWSNGASDNGVDYYIFEKGTSGLTRAYGSDSTPRQSVQYVPF